jgi:hypothetical protein
MCDDEVVSAANIMCTAGCKSKDAPAPAKQDVNEGHGPLPAARTSNLKSAITRGLRKLLGLIAAPESEKIPRPKPDVTRTGHTYVASSFFLHQCYAYLTSFDSEAVHFVTGPLVDGKYVLDTFLPFEMSQRTWGMAVGDLRATHELLQTLDDFGFVLTGYFHTHPGRGELATRPSAIDLALQEKLERAGYPTIGAIFSQDRFLRFFSLRTEFTIEIYGLKIEKEEKNVYRLTQTQDLPLRWSAVPATGRRRFLPSGTNSRV